MIEGSRVVVSVGADTREGEQGLDRIIQKQAQFISSGKYASREAEGFGNTIRNFIGGAAVGQAVNLVGSLTAKYNEQQQALARLRTAVDNSGTSFAAEEQRINKAIEAGKNLAFADQDVAASLSVLVNSTGNLDEALRRQKIAMDFSVGAHIDLFTASRLLGRVTDQNIAFLRRYGVQVDKNATSVEVLNKVEAVYAGQAKSRADSSLGATLKIQNAIEDIKATAGGAVQWLAPLATIMQGFGLTSVFASGGLGALLGRAKGLPGALGDVGRAAIGVGAANKLAGTYTGELVAALAQSDVAAAAAVVPYTASYDALTNVADGSGAAADALGNLGSTATITSTALDLSKVSKGAKALEGISSGAKLASAGMTDAAVAGDAFAKTLGTTALAETNMLTLSAAATGATTVQTGALAAHTGAAAVDTDALAAEATAFTVVGGSADVATTSISAETTATVLNANASGAAAAKLGIFGGVMKALTPASTSLVGLLGYGLRLGVLGAAGVAAAAGVSKVGASLVDLKARVGTTLVTDIPVLGGIVRGLSDASDAMGMFSKLVQDRGILDTLGAIKDQISRANDPLIRFKDNIQAAQDKLDQLKKTDVRVNMQVNAENMGKGFEAFAQGGGLGGSFGNIQTILGIFGMSPDSSTWKRIMSFALGFNGVDIQSAKLTPGGLEHLRDAVYQVLGPAIRQTVGVSRSLGGEGKYAANFDEAQQLLDKIKAEGGVGKSSTLKNIATEFGETQRTVLKQLTDIYSADKQDFDATFGVIMDQIKTGLADAGADTEKFKSDQQKQVQDVKQAYLDLNDAVNAYGKAVDDANQHKLQSPISPSFWGAQGQGPAAGGGGNGPNIFQSIFDLIAGGHAPAGGGGAAGGHEFGGFVGQTGYAKLHGGEYVLRRDEVDALRGGLSGGNGSATNVTVNLSYSGPATPEAASALGNDIVDIVTEALRMQNRRVGNRASPFGVAV